MRRVNASCAPATALRTHVDRLLHLGAISSGDAFDRALLAELRRLSVHPLPLLQFISADRNVVTLARASRPIDRCAGVSVWIEIELPSLESVVMRAVVFETASERRTRRLYCQNMSTPPRPVPCSARVNAFGFAARTQNVLWPGL